MDRYHVQEMTMRTVMSFFIKSSLLSVLFLLPVTCTSYHRVKRNIDPEKEIFYHLFLRSFYDSDGDSHGDLNGLCQKLDYLQELGVTAVLLTPLYDSPFYHNYFPTDFYRIDPEYGTLDNYISLLKEMHRRKMKLIMDMEIHYVTNQHEWFRDSYMNPASPFSDYIIYRGPDNTDPEPILWNIDTTRAWGGQMVSLWTTNLYNPKVVDYQHRLFRYWVDPNGDGDFADGVDGFRIDHIMDNLDWKNIRTDLLQKFWKPLFTELKMINPDLLIIGEQADWGYGDEYFMKAGLDIMFNFPLRFAFVTFDKQKIMATADSAYSRIPENKSEIIFVENHDIDRLASDVNRDLSRLKIAAALTILFKGIPSIYYGQEIGMTGKFVKFGDYDTNDILRREAFEWYTTVAGSGMALWYKDSGPWWTQTNLRDHDGISLEEQRSDSSSLWNFYRNLICLRSMNPAIQTGHFEFIQNDQEQVLSFIRWNPKQTVLVLINLGNAQTQLNLERSSFLKGPIQKEILYLMGIEKTAPLSEKGTGFSVALSPHEIQVWQVNGVK